MFIRILSVLVLVLTLGLNLNAQSITGRISGTVAESQGAVIPGATVKILNIATQQERATLTDSNGYYVITNLPVGDYRVSVELQGFKKSVKSGYSLTADGRVTIDFSLDVGNVTESVEIVASSGETVNTTSGEIERIVDQVQVQDLALNGRNFMQLLTLIPGAPLTTDDSLDLMTSLDVKQPVNGNRGNANLLTVDGGFNLASGSNNSLINNVGIEFIREVSIKSSNFSAEYGRNSGASINVVTRSGTNEYHGSAYEYLRNEVTDANSFFNNSRHIEKPSLRYNNFGFSFGGPIKKDKLFFFGGIEWKLIRRFETKRATLPTVAERNGDFSYRLRGPDGKVGTDDDGVLRDPTKDMNKCKAPVFESDKKTVKTKAIRDNCFGGLTSGRNQIPLGRITTDGRAIANVYAAMAARAASYTDTHTSNNAYFQERNPFNFRQEMLRLDYKFNDKHSIYGRYLHDDYELVDPYGTFIDSPVPTIPTNRSRPGYSYQVGHTWLISPTLINEFKVNASWNKQRMYPEGDLWKRETHGFQYQQLFDGGGRFNNSIPNVTVSGFATFEGANGALISPTTDISLYDSVSLVRGSHAMKFGGTIIRNRVDQNGRSIYPGSIDFNSSGFSKSTNNAFADALLGNYRRYSEASVDPVGFFRYTQIESYVSDNWRVNRKLGVEIGVRYQWVLPIYTKANNIVNFDASLYDPTKAVSVNTDGTIDTSKGGNRYNGLIRAGNGVPYTESGRIPNAYSDEVLKVPAGAPRGLYDAKHLWAPRFGFAYAPTNDNLAIRGGFGIFYDRAEGNIIFSTANIPPYIDSAQYENGNLASLITSKAQAAPFSNINTINKNLDVPYTMNYSLSVQRQLPWGIFGEIAYVGNQSRHLLRQPDINQPTYQALLENQKRESDKRYSTNYLRPYKGYASILQRLSDTNSNYNALQVYATKRKGAVTATVSYTWSKSLADASGNGDNLENPFNRGFSYGPTSFDRRHILVTTYVLRLPYFRKSNAYLKNSLGGWELSGITRWQTGAHLTPIVSGIGIPGNRRADSTGISTDGQQAIDEWFNPEAFSVPLEDRRGNAGVGVIVGPGRYYWDLSLRKQFSITERVKFRFQADFFNAWNCVNFNNPNVTVTSTDSFGTISGAAPGRNIQFGMRLSF